MARVEDHLAGEPFALVYDAPALPLPLDGGRWAVARQVRQHVREHGATAVLRTVDAIEGEQVWRAGEPGVSLAAAIDAWSAEAEGIGPEDAIVVPMDVRTYFAEREESAVERETVLADVRAVEKVQELQRDGRTVRGYGPGAQREVLDGEIEFADLPFDASGFRYGWPLVEFARRGLFHPAYPIAVAVLVALPLAGLVYWEETRSAAAAVAADLQRRNLALSERQGEFGGGAQLRQFAGVLGGSGMLALQREGLNKVEYTPASQMLRLVGEYQGFPRAARAYAQLRGGEFTTRGGSWEVVRGIGALADVRPINGFPVDEVGAAMYRAGRAAGAKVEMGARVDGGAAVEVAFRFVWEEPRPRALAVLGDRVSGRPVALDRVACQFGAWVVEKCEVEVSVKGTSG